MNRQNSRLRHGGSSAWQNTSQLLFSKMICLACSHSCYIGIQSNHFYLLWDNVTACMIKVRFIHELEKSFLSIRDFVREFFRLVIWWACPSTIIVIIWRMILQSCKMQFFQLDLKVDANFLRILTMCEKTTMTIKNV